MTGRQLLIQTVVSELLKHHPENLSDSRIWETIEGVVHASRRASYPAHLLTVKDRNRVLRYWDSITDPDGPAANRLVQTVIKTLRRNAEFNLYMRELAAHGKL